MPRALAIETSGRLGSVAIVDDESVVAERQFPHGLKYAAGMLPMIAEICREHHWLPQHLEEVYVSAGPGSFTGLRIGITLAKTLAFATGAKIVAVPSVHVLALNAPPDARHVIIVLDAKRGQIFTARFERMGTGWVEREPAHLDTLQAMLDRSPRPVHLLGEGIPFHTSEIPKSDEQTIITPSNLWTARAAFVAKIGQEMAGAGEFFDPYTLTPIYIRLAEAEEKWRQQNAR